MESKFLISKTGFTAYLFYSESGVTSGGATTLLVDIQAIRKKKRRGSLHIQLESHVLKDLAKTGEEAEVSTNFFTLFTFQQHPLLPLSKTFESFFWMFLQIIRVRQEQEKAEKQLRRRSTSNLLGAKKGSDAGLRRSHSREDAVVKPFQSAQTR